MKQTMKRLPEQMLRDEAEMRAFYQSVGIRPEITELAIRARRIGPCKRKRKPPLQSGRRPPDRGAELSLGRPIGSR
jgi:hypothetical protein